MKLHERISFLFTAVAYITVGVLILIQPKFFFYWIAAIFFIQGLLSFIRAFTIDSEKSA